MLKKLICLLMLFGVLAYAGNVNAVGIAYDGMDYAPFSQTIVNDLNGGTGWDGKYTRSNAFIGTGSLVPPAGYTLPTTGNKVDTIAGAGRIIGRDLASPIDLSPAVSATYYFSLLWRREVTVPEIENEWENTMELRLSSGAVMARYGNPDGSNDVKVQLDGVNPAPSGKTMDVAKTWLIVGKLVTNPAGTDDEGYIKTYEGDGVGTIAGEPAIWDSSQTADMSGMIVEFTSSGGPGMENWIVDEIRIGTTFADVAPEPTTLSLLGVGLLAAVRRRKVRNTA